LGSGGGSGLKLGLFSLGISFAAFSTEETIVFGILGLGVTTLFILIPVFGGKNIKSGLDLLELKTSVKQGANEISSLVSEDLNGAKKRSATVFAIMVVLFVGFSIIPFATTLLGNGFYVTVLGAIVTYLGARFAINKLPSGMGS